MMAMKSLMILMVLVAVSRGQPCPVKDPCSCKMIDDKFVADCRAKDLTEIPEFYDDIEVDVLDLSDNNIELVPANSFKNIKPKKIILKGTRITDISFNAFEDVGDYVESLDLGNTRTLKFIPTLALIRLPNLKDLSITVWEITELPANCIEEVPKLKYLTIYGSNMRTIHADAFAGIADSLEGLTLGLSSYVSENDFPLAVKKLINLKTLMLPRNQIGKIPAMAFKGMTKLKSVNLRENYFHSDGALTADSFRDVAGTLEYLNLDECGIETVPKDAFSVLSNLKTLRIGYNSIKNIKNGDFGGLDSLKELYFHQDPFPTYTNSSFEDLGDSLKRLSLNKANLMEIPTGLLGSIKSLKTAYLEENNIESIPEAAFDGVSATYFGLRGNKISSVSLNAFRKIVDPKKRISLDLSNNELSTLEFLAKPCSYEYVQLDGNPINCDCTTINVTAAMPDTTIIGKCATPLIFKGVSIDLVPRQDKYTEHCPENKKNYYFSCPEIVSASKPLMSDLITMALIVLGIIMPYVA